MRNQNGHNPLKGNYVIQRYGREEKDSISLFSVLALQGKLRFLNVLVHGLVFCLNEVN